MSLFCCPNKNALCAPECYSFGSINGSTGIVFPLDQLQGPTPFTDGTGITECFKYDISKEEFFISTRKLDASGNPLE